MTLEPTPPIFPNCGFYIGGSERYIGKIARNNAVVVLTCNMGQSVLLMNFACSAQRRGFDLGNILVFPSDVETKEIAEGLGLTTYYDEKVCLWRTDAYIYKYIFHSLCLCFSSIQYIWITSRTWGNCPREKQGGMEVSVFNWSHFNYLRSQISSRWRHFFSEDRIFTGEWGWPFNVWIIFCSRNISSMAFQTTPQPWCMPR